MIKKNIYIFLLLSTIFSNTENFHILSDKLYTTGEDGVIRMNINIIGNVAKPGNYLVYDGIDIMSALSLAGGFLSGSNLKNVIVFRYNGEKQKVDLSKILHSDNKEVFKLNPRDTILIEQKVLSKFLSSNIAPLFISVLNLAITLERTN